MKYGKYRYGYILIRKLRLRKNNKNNVNKTVFMQIFRTLRGNNHTYQLQYPIKCVIL